MYKLYTKQILYKVQLINYCNIYTRNDTVVYFLIFYHYVFNMFLFSFYSSGIWEKAYAGFMKQLER